VPSTGGRKSSKQQRAGGSCWREVFSFSNLFRRGQCKAVQVRPVRACRPREFVPHRLKTSDFGPLAFKIEDDRMEVSMGRQMETSCHIVWPRPKAPRTGVPWPLALDWRKLESTQNAEQAARNRTTARRNRATLLLLLHVVLGLLKYAAGRGRERSS